jgi:hypothetical protein
MADTKAEKPKKGKGDDDILAQAKEDFETAQDAEDENRRNFEDDKLFYQGGPNQWPQEVIAQRQMDGRPALTINRIPAFCRQVTNEARQNKMAMQVHPADNDADPETADIIRELIRNIEVTSDADVAYETGQENAVQAGWGYWKLDIENASDDTFDKDIKIRRVANPLAIYGDPHSTAADSSDWDTAFDLDRMSRKRFEREYGDVAVVDWDSDVYRGLGTDWLTDDEVVIAKYWLREPAKRHVAVMSDGSIIDYDRLEEIDPEIGLPMGQIFDMQGITVTREDYLPTKKVKCYTMTGAEVLDSYDWPGRYIPIIPVYGNELWIEGRRYLTSLFHDAKDAQMNFNVWRSAATELVGLSPKTPFIAPKGAISPDDADKWAQANVRAFAYLEYDSKGGQLPPPQRQPFAGVPAGVVQEALNAADDMKSIMGLFDASLGARSNETSGRAINARKVEGDVSTFNFQDNVSRALRHTGRVIIDLIPAVYQGSRIIRVMGNDNKARNVPLGQPTPALDKDGNPQQQPVMGPDGQPQQGPDGNPMMETVTRVYDLTLGKYDITVETGPAFQTRREEAAAAMTEMMRAYPPSAPVIGPLLVRSYDFPDADEIADKLEQTQGGIPPEVQKMIEDGKKQISDLTQKNQSLTADNVVLKAQKELAQVDAQKAKLVTPEAPEMVDPLAVHTEQLKLRAAEQTALAAFYTAEAKVHDVLNPPETVAPEPNLNGGGGAPHPGGGTVPPKSRATGIHEALGAIAQHMANANAPKKIVYGPDGRPSHTEPMPAPVTGDQTLG